MKTPTHVICPDEEDIPGGKLPSYLTAGERYEVVNFEASYASATERQGGGDAG